MNDGSDSDNGKPFSSDDENDLVENTGIKEQSFHQSAMNESAESDNLFDSLKEEESPKPKPKPRKLGAKSEVVKDPSAKKRSKKSMGSDDDSPIKVSSTSDFIFVCFSCFPFLHEKWIFLLKSILSVTNKYVLI